MIDEKKLSLQTFLHLAMVPVYVAGALVFGVMLLALTMDDSEWE